MNRLQTWWRDSPTKRTLRSIRRADDAAWGFVLLVGTQTVAWLAVPSFLYGCVVALLWYAVIHVFASQIRVHREITERRQARREEAAGAFREQRARTDEMAKQVEERRAMKESRRAGDGR